MARKIEFRVNIDKFDKDLAKAYRDARDVYSKAAQALTAAFDKSERRQAIKDISATGDMGQKLTSYTRIENNDIVATTFVEVSDELSKSQQFLSIGEKTVNALLTGKLLSDDEKKSLLKRLGVEFSEQAEKAGA